MLVYNGYSSQASVPFYYHGLTLIPAWIIDYIHYKGWDGFTYPFLIFNGVTVEVFTYPFLIFNGATVEV